MQTLYLFLIGVSLVSALTFWPLSGVFVNWFWQDEKEEAEMILADERSTTNYSKATSMAAILALLFVLAAAGVLLHQSTITPTTLTLKSLLILYFVFIGVVDFRTMMLPDILNYIGLWLALLIASFGLNPFNLSLHTCVLGAFGSYMVCWLVIHIGYIIFKKAIMGYGDAKYLAMLGALFGFKMSYLTLVLGVVFVTIFSVLMLLFTKDNQLNKPTPFGPFLSGAAITMIIFYQEVLAYMQAIYPSLF